MGFLSNVIRNRRLFENLSREPMAQRIDPISTNPFGNFPMVPMPIAPQPIDNPIGPAPIPRPIPAPVLPPVFNQPIAPPIAPPAIDRPILQKPIIPPRRDDFMSIERIDEPRDEFIPSIPNENPIPFVPPVIPQTPISPPVNIGGPPLDTSLIPEREILERPIIPPRRDDFISIERLGDERLVDAPVGNMQIGNGIPFTPPVTTPPPLVEPIIQDPVTPLVDPVVTPTTTTVDTPVTTIPQDVRGQVDPVLAQQDAREIQTDPLLRALYFGTADQPGYINQLQQATANLIGSDVPLQQTAGLSELEQMAQDRAIADLGVAEPFVGERADLLRGTTRQFDPSMTQQFFNPYEDRVVQQTIQDVLEAGEKRDIAQRAQDIQTGGLSAFGSRARLTAADRQEALGRGLAEALGGIRQAGFSEAQRNALNTFDRQRLAEQQAATGIGQVGTQLADLRERERAGLAGFGKVGRGIDETGLSRLFQQQVDAQGRPLQALQVTGQLLPQFQAGSTQIDSQYRLPVDPSAQGLGAAFSAYSALAPKQGAG